MICVMDHIFIGLNKQIIALFAIWRWICLGVVLLVLLRTVPPPQSPVLFCGLDHLIPFCQLDSVSIRKPSFSLPLGSTSSLPPLTYPHHASIFTLPVQPRFSLIISFLYYRRYSVPPIALHLVHQRMPPESSP